MKIDTTFPSKFIIKELDENQVIPFLAAFVKNAWMEHDIPEGNRKVKENKKLTLDHLPKDFNINDVAEKSFKKGILHLDRIGFVNIWISLIITKATGIHPGYKIEIDKFSYEKDGHSLKNVVDKSLSEI